MRRLGRHFVQCKSMPSTALCNQFFRGINSVANFNWQYILYRNIPVSPGGDNSIKWRLILPDESILKLRSLKPGFHMIVRIVRIVPVVSKNFDTIGTTETIAGFHMIVSIPSNTEDARSSAIFLGPTTEFLARYSKTKWRTSIAEQVSRLVNFLFFRFCAVEELEESHEDTGFGFDRYIRSEKN